MDRPPVIDLAASAPGALAEALVESSCALIVGHGIDPGLRAEMAAVSAAFFDLPEDEKALVRWPGTGQWKGWQPVYAGAAEITGERVPDLVERFEVQEIDDFGMWPSRPSALRPTWVAYYRACAALASDLMLGIARALDLPAEDLPAWTSRQYANLVVNNYPAQPEPPLPGQVRVGPHTDRGGFTLLAADDAPGGLEVRLPGSRDWIAVQIPREAFLVQAGDLLSRWTNRLIRANAHRVVNPSREKAADARRQAVVFFHYPSLDSVVTPAPSCVAASGEPPLTPLHAGEHLLHRQAAFASASAERYGEVEDLGDLE